MPRPLYLRGKSSRRWMSPRIGLDAWKKRETSSWCLETKCIFRSSSFSLDTTLTALGQLRFVIIALNNQDI